MGTRFHEHLDHGSCCDGGDGKISLLIGKHHAASDHPRRDRPEHRPDQRCQADNGRRGGEHARGGWDHPDTLVELLGGIDALERRLFEPARDAPAGRWVRHCRVAHGLLPPVGWSVIAPARLPALYLPRNPSPANTTIRSRSPICRRSVCSTIDLPFAHAHGRNLTGQSRMAGFTLCRRRPWPLIVV